MASPDSGHITLSVVVVGHNMRRELPRTLETLQDSIRLAEQQDRVEVIVVDSNSTMPIEREQVAAMGQHFRHLALAPPHPSPCIAMNTGIAMARGRHVALMIDGARMVSPGVITKTLQAFSACAASFVYTLSLHLGDKPQDLAISEGYDQKREDALLDTVAWREDGYRLFDIAALANSSRHGYLGMIAESNFIAASKSVWEDLGGLDEAFTSRGGGFANLDLLNRLMQREDLQPTLLLGEATFHQFHGGVATNVRPADRPMAEFHEEYARIRGQRYQTIYRSPVFYGDMPAAAWRFWGTAASITAAG